MKAIILAGGMGKRLRPVTDYIPKSLIPLNNVPIIEWQIKYLKKFKIDEIIICTGHKTEMIENYLIFFLQLSNSEVQYSILYNILQN